MKNSTMPSIYSHYSVNGNQHIALDNENQGFVRYFPVENYFAVTMMWNDPVFVFYTSL
jgi:hypothetical protein